MIVSFKKKILGPGYRKFVRPIIQNYKTRKITKEVVKSFEVDIRDIKVVGFLQIHNESKKGNLQRVLKHLSKFCEDIVIYDDGSTDDSYEVASQYTQYIIKANSNDFTNELKHKQKLLNLALSLKPDWIVWLDADEVFDREGEYYAIRGLCKYGESNNIDGFSFQEFNLWKSQKKYRTDENWNRLWQIRLWKNNGQLKFETKSGLHNKLHPTGLKKIYKSDVKVIHYGFSTEEKIEEKYQMYKKHGQVGWKLDRIKNEKGINLKPFSIDWFPISTLKVVVICLIYKSTKYIEFVLNSFNKYTKDTEFLFVVNDGTEKIKKYLEEKKINHLIFENKDKEEHYIKRVYRAWNFGGVNANGDIIVFVNSDMVFSKGWLDNLLKNIDKEKILTSRLVESGKLESGETAISKNFGRSYKEFDDSSFQDFANYIKEDKLVKGGLFMPCMIYKDTFVKSGGYPIGNRIEKSEKITSGDWIFFYETLKSMGIKHYTVYDSIVYHIQEGEMDD